MLRRYYCVLLFVFGVFIQKTPTSQVFGKFSSVNEDSVTFYLFDRENFENYVVLSGENLKRLDGGNNKKIFCLMHGWTESRNKTWFEDLKNALLEKFDVNVIQIDYSQPVSNRYPIAALLSKSIAKIIAKFIQQIPNVDLNNVTLIGHSLGGQIAGLVGKQIFTSTSKKVGKIIALDPAGPLFSIRSEKNRLTPNDAEIVEAIHTDKTLGFYKNVGHVDFYVNPNKNAQPGCEKLDFWKTAFCSHHVSYGVFIESIRSCNGLMGVWCESELKYLQGGCDGGVKLCLFFDSFNKTGAYYLQTDERNPKNKAFHGADDDVDVDFGEIEEYFM